MEIMKLIPTGKDYLWGGTRLREEYGKKIDLTPLAETWECSVHPDGPSYVANGIYKGQTLAEVLAARPEYLGTKVENGELPVLVKFIDAKKDLSVQVHPDDAYAREHEGDNGKTEMWYVIDADEGASLIYGFQHEVTEEILRKAVETGTLGKHLQKVPVHKGDTYFVPAGTVHGIGKGILVAEIQESSNVTYRVYDYDRVDKNGKKRELHFDKAVQVMNMKVAPDVSQRPRIVKYYSGCSRELLCRCKYFETERIQVTKGFAFSVMDTSFQVLMCLNGYGEVQTMDAEQKPMRFSKGETMFLSAGLGRCLVVGDSLPVHVEYFYKKTKFIAVGTSLAAGINIALNYIFIRKYGYTASAWTTLVSYILLFVFHWIIAKRINKNPMFPVKMIVVSIGSLIVYSGWILCVLNYRYIRWSSMVAIIVGMMICNYRITVPMIDMVCSKMKRRDK